MLSSESMLPTSNIIILGAPASGKGTQCDLLVERYGLLHISTGDLLRARSRFLPELAEYMDKGVLVPDELITQVLRERLSEPDASGRGVLLDGYPRTTKQAEMLAETNMRVDHVLLLDVPDDVVIERVEGRRIDPVSGRIYHVSRLPADAQVRARLIQRRDDTREAMKVRLAEFHANVAEITSFYHAELRIVKFRNVIRSGQTDINPEQMFDAIRQALEADQYWGTRFETQITVKEYECGSSAADLISLSRFFEHMRWRMVNNGCLKDAHAKCVMRAQSVQLSWPLTTAAEVTVKCFMDYVGFSSVGLGFTLVAQDTGTVLGSGSCELVYIDVDESHARRALQVPGRERLLQLVESSSARQRSKKQRGKDDGEQRLMPRDSHVLVDEAQPYEGAWCTEALVTPADVDGSGSLQTSCIMRRALDTIFLATVDKVAGLEGLEKMPVRRMAIELLQMVSPGSRVTMCLWAPGRRPVTAHLRMVRVCFHIYLSSKSTDAPSSKQVNPDALLVGRGEADLEVSVEPSRL